MERLSGSRIGRRLWAAFHWSLRASIILKRMYLLCERRCCASSSNSQTHPDYKMEHWGIKAKFINAMLEEDFWIRQADGHQQEGSGGMFCKHFPAFYGLLRQAGQAWEMFSSILSAAGFSQLEGAFVACGWCVVGKYAEELFLLHSEQRRVCDAFYEAVGCLWWLARITKLFRYLWMLLLRMLLFGKTYTSVGPWIIVWHRGVGDIYTHTPSLLEYLVI